jgi:hypothetical protein
MRGLPDQVRSSIFSDHPVHPKDDIGSILGQQPPAQQHTFIIHRQRYERTPNNRCLFIQIRAADSMSFTASLVRASDPQQKYGCNHTY